MLTGENPSSPLVLCGPQGLQFDRPVELRLPNTVSTNSTNLGYTASLQRPKPLYKQPFGKARRKGKFVSTSSLSSPTSHFSPANILRNNPFADAFASDVTSLAANPAWAEAVMQLEKEGQVSVMVDHF